MPRRKLSQLLSLCILYCLPTMGRLHYRRLFFSFLENKSVRGTAALGFCVQWPEQEGASEFGANHPLLPEHELLSSGGSGFVGFAARSRVFCFPGIHEHTSCPERIQFRVEHKHPQSEEELCAPSGPGDPACSWETGPWHTAFQAFVTLAVLFAAGLQKPHTA